ncbi:unnamed protein product [Polarella glacialis]|uniref:EF-hand domain-containing protein n=1 Tax=Polarella glacialis TaxID=89957 RepID=A0A813FCN7_POLGL|nr:unnamed protein product [Polarella glacialis]
MVQPRIQAATKQVTEALQRSKENKDKIAKKIVTAKRGEKRVALFKKYDKDGDGLLNRKEIEAYSKGEFSFVLPVENLDRILRQLCKSAKKGSQPGLASNSLQLLKTAIGIARDEAKGKVKRVARLEREAKEREEKEQKEAELNARKLVFSTQCQALMAELEELEPKIKESEEKTEAMVLESNLGQITKGEDAKQRLKDIETLVTSTHASISSVQTRGQELSVQVAEDTDMVELMRPELAALGAKTESQDLRLRKALTASAQARQLALNRAFLAYETLRMDVAAKLRVCIETQGGKPDDLYDAIASGSEIVTRKKITSYLELHQAVIEPEKLESLFPDVPEAGEEDGSLISREAFMKVVRIFYKVVKEIVLSDNLLIEQSDQLRRMDIGEVMEVFQGPMLDPSVGVYRIHGKALRDGIVGWVTVAGNQGITFLMPGGNLFKVLRPAKLTAEIDLESTEVKDLVEGEVLQVIAWERSTTASGAGVTRIKGQLQGEDIVGWTSIGEGAGIQLEVV